MRVGNESGDALDNKSRINNKTNSYEEGENEDEEMGTLENGAITKFYFEKLIRIEYSLAFSIIVSIFLIIVSTELNFPPNNRQVKNPSQIIKFCLTFNCINTAIAIFISTLRAFTILELEKKRKAAYQNATLGSTRMIFTLVVECFVIMVQPYPFFEGSYFETSNSYEEYRFLFPLNDLLTILSLSRFFIIFRAMLLLTPYMNNRCTNCDMIANRLCKMYGCQANFSFSLKCLFKDNPLLLIIILFSTSAMIFSYAVYLAERNASTTVICDPNIACTYANALWLILMTITTVGYGDYFPQTPLGRIIIFLVAIWGTFIVSITVVVVSNTLKMEKKQKEAGIVIQKLYIRAEVKEKAGKLIGYSMLRRRGERRGEMEEMERYGKMVKRLKKDFSVLRNKLKMMRNQMDFYDEIASNFLNINDDIDILNRNQQKITNFIHENLQFRDRTCKIASNVSIEDKQNEK